MEPSEEVSLAKALQMPPPSHPVDTPTNSSAISVDRSDNGSVLSGSSGNGNGKMRFYRYGSFSSSSAAGSSIPAIQHMQQNLQNPPSPSQIIIKSKSGTNRRGSNDQPSVMIRHPSVGELVKKSLPISITAPSPKSQNKSPLLGAPVITDAASVHTIDSDRSSAVLSITYSMESPKNDAAPSPPSEPPASQLVGGLSYSASSDSSTSTSMGHFGRRYGTQARSWLPSLKTPTGSVSNKNYKHTSNLTMTSLTASDSGERTDLASPPPTPIGNVDHLLGENESGHVSHSNMSSHAPSSKIRHNSSASITTSQDEPRYRNTASVSVSSKVPKSGLSSASVLVNASDDRKSSVGSAPVRQGNMNISTRDDVTTTESIRTGGRKNFFSTVEGSTELCPPLGYFCHVPTIFGCEPPQLAGHTGHIIKNDIHVFGGRTPAGVSNKLYVFNCVTMTLSNPTVSISSMKMLPRLADSASALVGNRFIYIFGGHDETGAHTNNLYVWDTRLMIFSKIAVATSAQTNAEGNCSPSRVPPPRRGHTMVASNDGFLYIFGGIQANGQVLNDIWKVFVGKRPPKQAEFSEVISLDKDTEGLWPEARVFHSAHVVDKGASMVIYGGNGVNSAVLGDVWYFIFEQDRWLAMPQGVEEKSQRHPAKRWVEPFECKRTLHASCMIGDTLVVVGGHDGQGLVPTISTLYLPEQKWTTVVLNGVQLPGQCYHGCIYYDSRLFLTGGLGINEYFQGLRLVEVPGAPFMEFSTNPDATCANPNGQLLISRASTVTVQVEE